MIGAIIVSLLFSALFSGLEIAFLSSNRLRVELKKQQGGYKNNILAGFFENPSTFIGTCLVGNNISLVMLGILINEPLAQKLHLYFPDYLEATSFTTTMLVTLITTVVVLIIGEFIPKTIFRLYSNNILSFFTIPMNLIKTILSPIVWIMDKISNFLLRVVFKLDVDSQNVGFSRTDLAYLVSVNEQNDQIHTELFENALELRNQKIRDCMIPRTEIVGVDVLETSFVDLRNKFAETGKSKLVVYEGNLDHILGYVHHQQVLKKPQDLRKIMFQMELVQEVTRVQDLMYDFLRTSKTMAYVVDEYGTVSGLITLEDILEQLFGDIEDEHDTEEQFIEESLGDGKFRFSARLEIDYLNEEYNLDLPEGDYYTLSGYIMEQTQRIPEEGEVILLNDYEIMIEKRVSSKIDIVVLQRLNTSFDEN